MAHASIAANFTAEKLPALLQDLELLPLLIRRYLERNSGKPYNPTEEEQIAFQKQFLARERITNQTDCPLGLNARGSVNRR